MKLYDSALKICPHCGNKTPHKLIFKHTYQLDAYNPDGSLFNDVAFECFYQLFECSTCHNISLYQYVDFEDEDDATLRFPKGYDLDKAIPYSVASNYKEAKQVQRISPNAFAVLIRRALEAMCDDRNVAPGRLQKRLEELSKRGEIPLVLAEITSVLRVLGNSGAHNTNQNVTVPMTWVMDKFFRTLVEYVYIAPHQLEEFKKQLDKNKDTDTD